MDDFSDLVARDFGLPPQGKSAPMKSSSTSGSRSLGTKPGSFTTTTSVFDDVFTATDSRDSMFGGLKNNSIPDSNPKPVFDKPVYDDDIFDGVPGLSRYHDVFASVPGMSAGQGYDDVFEGLGKKGVGSKRVESTGFDDLIPGFGGSSPQQQHQQKREAADAGQQKPPILPSKATSSMADNPFGILETNSTSTYSSSGMFSDPLEQISRPAVSEGTKVNSFAADGLFEVKNNLKNRSSVNNARDSSPAQSFARRNLTQESSSKTFEDVMPKTSPARDSDRNKSFGAGGVQNSETYGGDSMDDQSPMSNESSDVVWLSVAEIPLFTQPTSAPPPSRPPPPFVAKQKPFGANAQRKEDEYARQSSKNYSYQRDSPNMSGQSAIDKLEDFVMGKPQPFGYDHADGLNTEEQFEGSSAAAAMKDAMDKAQAKFKHGKEVRERERDAKLGRSRESDRQERDEDWKEKEKQERVERERKEREDKEKEQKLLEKEKELQQQRERETARRVVEMATKAAREKAAADALFKANQEWQREAVKRVQQEARVRAAAGAKAVAADKAKAEEIRKAAAAAKEKQQYPVEDLDFFGMGSRANSAPKQRATTSETVVNSKAQTSGSSDGSNRAASASPSIRKASSTTNIVNDLDALFGAPSPSGVFQEVEGESEERRRARIEREQRTAQRAAKALAVKNERDMKLEQEQVERYRISETLDFEIKRWAAGKEGNLRALLSTLQYVLWPDSGWVAVSVADLITADAVKKRYKRATLCVHPDKVQQKGSTLQQKFIAEKVFDILKEAWNKFSSEELS